MTDNRLTIRPTEWTPRDGRRSVGRPPKRWMDNIASYLCSIDTINGKLWHRYAQNRSSWKRLMMMMMGWSQGRHYYKDKDQCQYHGQD